MSYTFEVTVQRKLADRWPVVAQLVAAGAELPVRREGTFALDPDDLVEASPGEYGAVLGRALFREDVRDGFKQALARADDALHVLLYVEADELRPLRWERLAAPLDGGWTPLALDQRTPFAQHLPSATDRRFPPISRHDLRALIVVANPTRPERWRLTPFDVAETVRSVRESLGTIPSEVLAEVEGALGPPTLDALCNAITGQPYTLLHVVAHGRFKADDREPILFLSTPEGEVAPVPAGVLIGRLGMLRGARGLPHLTLLSTCESAAPEAEGVLGGLGQRLVRELGMPAVVAMTDKVTVASAAALASEFYKRLRRHGKVDLALGESYAGIAGRPDIAVPVPALFSRLAGRPLFSLAPDGHLTNGEIAYGLERLRVLLADRAPVLLDPFRPHAATLRGLSGADPAQLARERRVEREQALAGVDELCLEGLELTFKALANDQEPPSYDGRCPFKGLDSFKADDRPFFFGRDEWVRRLRERLERHPFLAVLGPSGSGKSSLVLAGLFPALQDREPCLEAAIVRPGSDPLSALEAKLAEVGDRPAAVVVDQFEEVFTLCTDPAARQAFLDRLLAPSVKRRVVVTMRADFWGDCASFPELRERMLVHQELIPPMTLEELRLAMTRQAEAVGLRFEPGLVGTILDDVEGEPGAMPLLQHALLELWNRRHGRLLKAEEYQTLGRVQGAIARTAEVVYGGLRDDQEQERVRDIFLRLVRLDDDGAVGELPRDTRRRVRLEDLVPPGGDLAATKALVNHLADRRLVMTTPRGDERLTEVEVAHEALIRHWPRLIGWLDENRAILQLRQGIGEAAEVWVKAERDENLLVHKGPRLQEAERLREDTRFGLNERERTYLDACVSSREKEQAERERQRRRRLQYLVGGLVASLVLATLAAVQWWRADLQRHRADEQRLNAQTTSARLALDRGLTLSEQGEEGLGLLWMARALEEAPGEHEDPSEHAAALRRAIRMNLQAWSRQVHAYRGSLEHPESVMDVAFSPDGKTILTGCWDGAARLWDAATNKPVPAQPMRHGEGIAAVSYSPDGKKILTGSFDDTARLWDANTGAPVGRPMRHQGDVRAVAFNHDGRIVATGGDDRVARLWDAATTESIGKPMGHQDGVRAVKFSPDGKILLTASVDGMARFWVGATAEPVISQPMRHQGHLWAAAFGPDGKVVATGGQDNTARLWAVPTGAPIGQPLHHQGAVESLAFSPDGKVLLTGSVDETVRLWNTATSEPIGQPMRQKIRAHHVEFSPDGKTFLIGSDAARLWDAATNEPYGQPLRPQGNFNCMAFGPDGRTVMVGSANGIVRLWDLTPAPHASTTLPHMEIKVNMVAFRPDGKAIATGSSDDTARLWDANTDVPIGEPMQHRGDIRVVAFSPDGKLLLTGGADAMARLWDAATAAPVGHPMNHEGEISDAKFRPDGGAILTIGVKEARLWDTASNKPIGQPMGHEGVSPVVNFSPDGGMVISKSETMVRLWEAATAAPIGQTIRFEARGTGFIPATAFRADGKVLLTGDLNGIAQLWNVPTTKRIGRPMRHHDKIFIVAFRPDGKVLLTASRDRTARLWDAATNEPIGEPMTHRAMIPIANISPDGRTVVTSDYLDARLWDAATASPIGGPLSPDDGVIEVAFHPDGKIIATGGFRGLVRLWDTSNAVSIGGPLRQGNGYVNVMFSPDGRLVLSQTWGEPIKLWRVPEPLQSDAARISVWVQVLTGMNLGPSGAIQELDGSTWSVRHRRLTELGGSPL